MEMASLTLPELFQDLMMVLASYVYVCVHVCAQSYMMLCDPMDCSPPGSSVHGVFQTRILERVATSYSRGSS